jgi:hypothetical protein
MKDHPPGRTDSLIGDPNEIKRIMRKAIVITREARLIGLRSGESGAARRVQDARDVL